jgi:carbamoyl-phosphate synthase large subunit
MDWLFEHCFIMPYPSGDPETLVERLAEIQDRISLDCIIPNFDVELPLYIHCAHELDAMGIHTYLPTKAQFALRNKAKLAEVAPSFGLKTPKTITVTSVLELQEAIADLKFPLMIKGSYYKAYRVTTVEQAIQRFYQLTAEWGYPIIVQEVINGIELNLVGVGDGKGGHLGLVTIKKMTVTEMGKIWSGVTIHHEGMRLATEAFLSHTKWKGAFEMECMSDHDGEIYLIEINPRFPAWIYFATGVGINLPSRLVRAALGLPIPARKDYEAGKLLMRYTYEIITDVAPLKALVTLGQL